ncbi:MAG: SMI1/KNR4 family protein [Candidatus Scalindua sp.]|nr:SMI1/KNR4 family protein [Candidatus Scalindua sp.]
MEEAIINLRELNEPVPKPLLLPTIEEINKIQGECNTKFHTDYVSYLLEASDVVYGVLEPATITDPESHTHLPDIANDAWEDMNVPKDLLPICEDNGDYYCMNSSGEVVFWSHNGLSNEKWSSLAVWIKEVWIEGN